MKFITAVFLTCLTMSALAQQNYPELLVSPRASQRLKREAAVETQNTFTDHLPVQVSGVTTFLAGALANGDLKKDSDGIGSRVAMVVGGTWITASLWMQVARRPFMRGFQEVKNSPYQSARDQLAAERLAEEHIDETARFYRKLKWLSVSTNLLASAYALSNVQTGSTGEALGYVGLVGALAPLLFSHRAEQVSEDQRSYKKKVLGPVTMGSGMILDPFRRSLVPGFTATATF